jgi:hypothetical protein
MQSGMQAKGQRKRERVSARRRPLDPTPEFSKSMKINYLNGPVDSSGRVLRAQPRYPIELSCLPFRNCGRKPLFQNGSHLMARVRICEKLCI